MPVERDAGPVVARGLGGVGIESRRKKDAKGVQRAEGVPRIAPAMVTS